MSKMYFFTDHAIQRCKEQNLNKFTILNELKKLPPLKGRNRWITKYGHTVILETKDNDDIAIINVIALKKYIQSKRTIRKGRNTF
jgi:hypothetical protein